VLLVCAGLITLLVIIYKGHTLSLVRARSQEVLEVAFAGSLCYTGLTGVTCDVQCLTGLTGLRTGLTGGALSAQVFGGERV
jgi:hypothetical protein